MLLLAWKPYPRDLAGGWACKQKSLHETNSKASQYLVLQIRLHTLCDQHHPQLPADLAERAYNRLLRVVGLNPLDQLPIDLHGEATSEKVALGWYLDGRITAVIGTHTHIPTADERVLPNGTAYQTDVGMSGPYDSVIGVEKELVLARFLTGMPGKFEPAKGNPKMCAALISCDGATGRAHHIQRIMLGE